VIGQVYEVRTTDSFFNNFDPANMGWRADKAKIGGGELIDTGYHPSYLMLHLAGGVPVEAAAMLSTHRLTFMEGEDSAQVLIRFDNGVVGQLVTSWAYQPAACTERFSVVGELGSLHSDGTTISYRLHDGTEESFTFEQVNNFVAEIGHFAHCLQTGERPPHTEKEGIEVLGMILAAYQSAKEKTIAPVLNVLECDKPHLGSIPAGWSRITRSTAGIGISSAEYHNATTVNPPNVSPSHRQLLRALQ